MRNAAPARRRSHSFRQRHQQHHTQGLTTNPIARHGKEKSCQSMLHIYAALRARNP